MQLTEADVVNTDERTVHVEDMPLLPYDSHPQQEPYIGLPQPSETHLPSTDGDSKMDVQDYIPSDTDDLKDATSLGTRGKVIFCLFCFFTDHRKSSQRKVRVYPPMSTE
jgi:hypothetical protein